MAGSYIPSREADLKVWAVAFAALITAAPATYGLAAPDAVAITTPVNAYAAAYDIAVADATRTSITIDAKNTAKAAMLEVIRPYAQQIRNDKTVLDADKLALGLTLPDYVPTPVAAPTDFPVLNVVSAGPLSHSLRWFASLTPDSRAKPAGCIGMLLFRTVGAVAVLDAASLPFAGLVTKQPVAQAFGQADIGKVCSYAGRFYTRAGLLGPWSQVTTFVITG